MPKPLESSTRRVWRTNLQEVGRAAQLVSPEGFPRPRGRNLALTIAPYGSSSTPGNPATINNALAACGTNQYVLLGSGTFVLSGTVFVSKSNCVLRGAGGSATILQWPNGPSTTCAWTAGGDICIGGNQSGPYYLNIGEGQTIPGSLFAFTPTGGFSQGSTSITVTNVGEESAPGVWKAGCTPAANGTSITCGIVNGDMIVLYQSNALSDNGGMEIADFTDSVNNDPFPATLEGNSYGPTQNTSTGAVCTSMGLTCLDWNQAQNVRVIGGCSSACSGAGPFILTDQPGFYTGNWGTTGAVQGAFVKPSLT